MNLTPLLDVIFCLLFFFILATSVKQERRALDVRIPESGQAAKKIEETPWLEVLITRENEIIFNGRTLNADELADALEEAKRSAPAPTPGRPTDEILIRTDGKADVQTFVEVSDACARAGLKAALMETLPKPER